MPRGKLNLVGISYGSRTVLEMLDGANGKTYAKTRCKCGSEDIVNASALKRGDLDSCRSCSHIGHAAKKGESHHRWRGGKRNVGSLAWAGTVLSNNGTMSRQNGWAEPAGNPADVLKLYAPVF